jgi:hypothetical protein
MRIEGLQCGAVSLSHLRSLLHTCPFVVLSRKMHSVEQRSFDLVMWPRRIKVVLVVHPFNPAAARLPYSPSGDTLKPANEGHLKTGQ